MDRTDQIDSNTISSQAAPGHAVALRDRHRHYRYYDLVMVGFVTVLLCSNLIGPAKLSEIPLPLKVPGINADALTFGAGNIFFPIGYIFGDVLTEVYGYARARKVIWAGFGALLFATIMANIIIWLPNKATNDYGRQLQPALELVFGNTFRISAASLIAFWCGDFANSFVMARMKLLTGGRWLWMRTIGSTLVGQGVDSLLFYPIAFAGIWAGSDLLQTCAFNWGFKVSIEVLFTPLTYLAVNFLKRAENEDFYDTDTNFTPFSLQD
jgi:uncharacterized integral membrane protein (TIGR00697 family)